MPKKLKNTSTKGKRKGASRPAKKAAKKPKVLPMTSGTVYSQKTDPTANQFFSKKQFFFGETGFKNQLQGKKSSESQIREDAVQNEITDGAGAGLHEYAPTNMRNDKELLSNPKLAAIQSGMRSLTNLTYFNREAQAKDLAKTGSEEVGGHTGTMKKGYTRRRGQGPAHDLMRAKVRSLKNEKDGNKLLLGMMARHLAITPHGRRMLRSRYLVGSRPNIKGVGTIEALGAKKRINAVKLARIMHNVREAQKLRAKQYAVSINATPPGSPLRAPINDDGSGGEPLLDDFVLDAPIPQFDGKNDNEKLANAGAWLTQGGRTIKHPELYNYKKKLAKKAAPKKATKKPKVKVPVPSKPTHKVVKVTKPVLKKNAKKTKLVTTSPLRRSKRLAAKKK